MAVAYRLADRAHGGAHGILSDYPARRHGGGYLGAHAAQRLDPRIVRGVVITTGCVMTVWFFTRSR